MRMGDLDSAEPAAACAFAAGIAATPAFDRSLGRTCRSDAKVSGGGVLSLKCWLRGPATTATVRHEMPYHLALLAEGHQQSTGHRIDGTASPVQPYRPRDAITFRLTA